MTKEERRKEWEKAIQEFYRIQMENNDGCTSSLFMFVLLLMLVCTLAGCKTVYVPMPEYHETHDTIVKKEIVEKEVIKEVAVKDSSSFRQDGDTIRIERWHWERDYRYEKALQAKIDSLTSLSRDTIYKDVPVEVEVPAELSSWQIFFMNTGKIAIILLLMMLLFKFLRR